METYWKGCRNSDRKHIQTSDYRNGKTGVGEKIFRQRHWAGTDWVRQDEGEGSLEAEAEALQGNCVQCGH